MNKPSNVSSLLRIALLLLMIGEMAAGCAAAPTNGSPAAGQPAAAATAAPAVPAAAPTAAPTAKGVTPTRPSCKRVANHPFYEDCQVLITQPEKQRDDLESQLRGAGFVVERRSLTQLYGTRYRELEALEILDDGLKLQWLLKPDCKAMTNDPILKTAYNDPAQSLKAYLYEITSGTVEEVVQFVNGLGLTAIASPNLSTGNIDVDQQGVSIQGFPDTIAPSPWSGPFCPTKPSAALNESGFRGQWAPHDNPTDRFRR